MIKARYKLLVILVTAMFIITLFGMFNVASSANNHGYISIAFDDGLQTEYDYAYPMLHQLGMNATYYAVSDKVGTSGYMNGSELVNLQSTGSEIGSHSKTHAGFEYISDSQIQQECQVSKSALQSLGLTINNFAYPSGSRNSHTDEIVAQYYRSARSAYIPPNIMTVPFSVPQVLVSGFAGETGDSTALARLKTEVDNVYSSNGWAIIFFHDVEPNPPSDNPYSINSADFQSFLNYVHDKGVPTVTVNQGLNLASSSTAPPTVSISPTSARVYNGQPLVFTSSVSGGRAPYSYQWYLNDSPVASVNGVSWTFTPTQATQAGTYQAYLRVTDALNHIGQSNIANEIKYNLYPLTMSTNLGSVSPSNGEYTFGSALTITATPPTAGTGQRYSWQGWAGTGTGSYTGLGSASGNSYTASITMNSAITETASWKLQYYLTLNSAHGMAIPVGSDDGWYDAGSTAYAVITQSTVAGTSGTQYVFAGWSPGALGSGSTSNAIVMAGPRTATAAWTTQYLLTINSPYGTVMGGGWYNEGTSTQITLDSVTSSGGTGIRYLFTGWGTDASGAALTSNTIVMNGPKTATTNWKIQYNVAVVQTGVASDYTGKFITVNGTSYGVNGFSAWSNSSDVYIFGYIPQITVVENSKQCLLTGVNGNTSYVSVTVTQPTTISGAYKTQYYLSVSSVYGSVGGAGWYDAGTSAYVTVIPLAVSGNNGVQNNFDHWSNDASGKTSPSNAITMDGPKTATANWATDNTQNSTPTPTPVTTNTPTSTPTATPSPTPNQTGLPSQSPTNSPSASPSQPPVDSYGYLPIVILPTIVLAAGIAIFFFLIKRRK